MKKNWRNGKAEIQENYKDSPPSHGAVIAKWEQKYRIIQL
jgi:hypothetical protein